MKKIIGGVVGERSEIKIGFDLGTPMLNTDIDTLVITSQCGYSPLGLLTSELKDNKQLVDTLNRLSSELYGKEELTIVGLRTNNPQLRNIIMTPTTESKYYRDNWSTKNCSWRDSIWKDYIYAITYFSLQLATEKFKSKHLGFTHLTNTGFPKDCSLTMAEAIGHFVDNNVTEISEIIFVGCCVTEEDLYCFSQLNPEGGSSQHRSIVKKYTEDTDKVYVQLSLESF
jgi:hypothetical protein